MNERKLSPTARRRRQIIADIEMGIAYVAGILTMVVAGMILSLLGVL